VQVEKPLDVIHKIVEDNAIEASHKILRQGVNNISETDGMSPTWKDNAPRRE
jgi:hypothetical protein